MRFLPQPVPPPPPRDWAAAWDPAWAKLPVRATRAAKRAPGGGKAQGFEGGQMKLVRRIPKRGFTNIYAKEYATINLSALEAFEDGAVVDAQALKNAGIVKNAKDGIKVLGNGELTKKLTVKAAKFSKSAAEKIEGNGGKAEVI